jgi:ribosomal protein S18 acetylase RimI-like enzyme
MIQISYHTSLITHPPGASKTEVVDFLHEHLGRFRDSKQAISKALDYSFSKEPGKGGYLLLAWSNDKLVGVVVMNRTGMSQYIPSKILVYIAVDSALRGQGIGTKLLNKVFELSNDEDIALHVEYDNPAKQLYERLGFRTKYAEMRWSRDN